MNELALFAGAGGGILGGHLLGWRTVCAVEYNAYARSVLLARQNDGTFPPFPIWDDVRTFDGRPWRGSVDVVSGGFPCQDISAAGRGDGLDGERSGLWSEMARIIGEVRPRFAFVENSPMLTSRGLGRVLGDLASMGFDAEWGVLGAADCGAPHQRDRIWIVAHSKLHRVSERRGASASVSEIERSARVLSDVEQSSEQQAGKVLAYAMREREQGIVTGSIGSEIRQEPRERSNRPRSDGIGRWPAEPGMGRVANGVANRADRIKAIGNGQVSRVAAAAFDLLTRG
jgi:DNA (cytosine-5)-methyltransferase 1